MCGIRFAFFRSFRHFTGNAAKKIKMKQTTGCKVFMRFPLFQISFPEPSRKRSVGMGFRRLGYQIIAQAPNAESIDIFAFKR